MEIKVSLPVAGSENGCVIRACIIDLTCCASSLAESRMSGLTKQCIFFLLIVDRRDEGYREAECYVLSRVMCFGKQCFVCAFHIGCVET